MEDIIQHLTTQIQKAIFTWTSKFYHTISFVDHKNQQYNFVVEFSLPTKTCPVPKATVKVFFACNELSNGNFELTYRFENQSLIHKSESTIRNSKMEKWIERILNEKALTTQVMFLGTEFEAERIKNDKIGDVFKVVIMDPISIELRKLNESLLSSSVDYIKTESSLDERTLEMLKTTMFDFFRSVDKDDMGVVSYEESREVLKAMDVELSEIELNNLMLIADKNANGMVEYAEFVPVGAEVMYGLIIKQQTEKDMDLEEEMMINQAVLVLFNDEIHDLTAILTKDCKEVDEEQLGMIPTTKVMEIFKNHTGVLSEREYELLYKKIENEYPTDFKYNELSNILFKYKVDIVKNGLMETNITKLEQYLRKLFEIFDTQKTGKIAPQTLMEALQRAEKIVLTQMQLYILRNFVAKDEDGNVDYIKASKFLAEMIKRFFSPSVLKKQAQFIEKGLVKADTFMEGWTQEALTAQINQIFQTYDVDKNKLLDKTEYKKLMTQAGINLTPEEIDAMMVGADKNQDGFVDFNEFQNHFYGVLKLIRRNKALYSLSEVTV